MTFAVRVAFRHACLNALMQSSTRVLEIPSVTRHLATDGLAPAPVEWDPDAPTGVAAAYAFVSTMFVFAIAAGALLI
jgi:hypothetical protein